MTKEWLAERMARTIRTDEVNLHFGNGERRTLDLRPGLRDLARPTLLLVGEMDPIVPPALAREMSMPHRPASLNSWRSQARVTPWAVTRRTYSSTPSDDSSSAWLRRHEHRA